MKAITNILAFFVLMCGYSQNAPIDFETTGNTWTWATFEAPTGFNDPAFNIVPNPSVDAINSSANVAQLVIDYPTSATWGSAGCESMHGADIGEFAVTTTNSTVSMMIYQEGFAAPVALKFATATSYALFETIVPNTVANAWVEVEFDMSGWIGDPNGLPDQIIFFPSYGPRSTGHTVYFDNVVFGEQGNNLNFNGIETVASPINASAAGMEYLHMDVWTPNSTAFRVKLVDFLNDGFQGANGDTEAELSFSLAQEEWVSLHIPLADFTAAGMTAFADLNQLIISSDPSGASIVYVDNVYYSSEPLSTPEFETVELKIYPNPTDTNWNVVSTNTITSIEVYDLLGKNVLDANPNVNSYVIDASALPTGVYFARVSSNRGSKTIKLIKQ